MTTAPHPPLRLEAGDPAAPRIEGHVELAISGETLALDLAVPDGPVAMETLLPVLHEIANTIVARGVEKAERGGKRISCAAGCGACCRQIVPLAESEVRAIARLVADMPEPRQSEVRARFAEALRRLFDSGLIDLLNKGDRTGAETLDLVDRYFRLWIACPFLEDESCSIHPVRPLICREYLVTSPPSACAALDVDAIDRVPLAGKLANSVLQASRGGGAETTAWIPLTAALHFDALWPVQDPTRTAPEQLAQVFAHLTR